jgi:uncharacterized protein (DUF697 family)
MSKLPVSAGAIRKLLRDIAASGAGEHFLAVGGARELAPLLRQQLRRGGAAAAAVRLGAPEGARVYVHVVSGEPNDGDIAVLRRARRAAVPVVAVAVAVADDTTIPYVLATDVVWTGAGDAFSLEAIARTIAVRLGEQGAGLAAQVPLLREPVSEELVASFARRNALVSAAVWRSGADLPFLAANELRLVLRLAQTHGAAGDVRDRLPELAATLGAGFGLRALARELLDLFPGAGWALEAAIAYCGTRAVGKAARLRFALAPTQRPGEAEPAAP